MLGIAALLFLIFLSIKLLFGLNKHYAAMVANEMTPLTIRALQLSSLLYILSLIAFVLPISWLAWLAPIPFGFLLLLPGIALGRKYSKLLECSGTDVGVEAGRAVSNIMWLGIGVMVFIVGNILVTLLTPSNGLAQ